MTESRLPQQNDLTLGSSVDDLKGEVREKLTLWTSFWRTREQVFRGTKIGTFSKLELDSHGLLEAWKFNLMQSTFAALPGVLLAKALGIFASPSTPLPIDPSLDFIEKVWISDQPLITDVFSYLWPIAFPFVLFMMARMMAWSSLKKKDSNDVSVKRATRTYLYLDGAYGFYPQMISTVGLVIATSSLAHASQIVAGIGYLSVGIGGSWQYVLSRWILVRQLYIFSFSYAVPAAIVMCELTVYLASAVIGLTEAALKQLVGAS